MLIQNTLPYVTLRYMSEGVSSTRIMTMLQHALVTDTHTTWERMLWTGNVEGCDTEHDRKFCNAIEKSRPSTVMKVSRYYLTLR